MHFFPSESMNEWTHESIKSMNQSFVTFIPYYILTIIYYSNCERTFGLAPPAKPALVVSVPTSITIGWFKRADPEDEDEEGPSLSTLLILIRFDQI